MRLTRTGSTTIARRAAGSALAVAVIALLVVLIAGSGSSGHTLYVDIPQATDVVPGQELREAGVEIGTVDALTAVDHGRAARLQLRIDDHAWPLTSASSMYLRWGGTIAYANRYINVLRGAAGAKPLADGATFPSARFHVPVEFDQVLTTFTPAVRERYKAMLDTGGAALREAQLPLHSALTANRAPAAVMQANSVLADFQDSEAQLTALIRTGDRVVAAAQSANPGFGQLFDGASTTFTAIASQAHGLQQTLEQAPRTFAAARTTLVHAERTLTNASTLSDALAPGVEQLRRDATPLSQVLRTVVDVAPTARTTVVTLQRAAPMLNPLLSKLTSEMPTFASIGRQGTVSMQCIRPFSPEIAGFFSDWDSFTAASDNTNRYVRLMLQVFPLPVDTPLNSAQVTQLLPQLRYAFPRPPGTDINQPWYQPQCGMTAANFNPAGDPMTRHVDPFSQQLITTNPSPTPAP